MRNVLGETVGPKLSVTISDSELGQYLMKLHSDGKLQPFDVGSRNGFLSSYKILALKGAFGFEYMTNRLNLVHSRFGCLLFYFIFLLRES